MSDVAPHQWEPVTLADCLEDFRNGWTYDTRATDGTHPITRIETISNGEIDYARVGLAQADPRIEAFRLLKDDILFSHINSVEHIGKVAIKRDEARLYHGMNLMRLRPNRRVEPAFLFALLQSDRARDHFRMTCKRAINQASLNKSEVGSYSFLLPPLDEQRRIAELIRSFDEAIEFSKSCLDSAQSLLSSLLAHYFPTDGDDNANNSSSLLSELITLQSGFAFKSDDYKMTGHFLIRIGNVQDGHVSKGNPKFVNLNPRTQIYELHAGDILTSLTGNIGRVARIETTHLPAALNQRVARIKPKPNVDIDPEYLFFSLRSPLLKNGLSEESGGAAQQNVSPKAIGRISIPLPELGEQRSIGATLLGVDNVVFASIDALERLVYLRSLLSSDLLSGRVRVPA